MNKNERIAELVAAIMNTNLVSEKLAGEVASYKVSRDEQDNTCLSICKKLREAGLAPEQAKTVLSAGEWSSSWYGAKLREAYSLPAQRAGTSKVHPRHEAFVAETTRFAEGESLSWEAMRTLCGSAMRHYAAMARAEKEAERASSKEDQIAALEAKIAALRGK